MPEPPRIVTMQLRYADGTGRAFHHRGSEADQGVVRQMFTHHEYSFGRISRGPELQGVYDAIVAARKAPLIIDAGANIGAAATWFATQFPKAQVVAFEPDRANYDLLLRNTEGLRVESHHAAIGSRDGRVNLSDPGRGEWAYRTEIADTGACEMMAMSRVVEEQLAAGTEPFIAKIDIEGAEHDLFQEPTAWVDRFPLLIVELHDWLMPKQRTSAPFLACVARRNRDFVYVGENVFSIRND
jgi:FkbM family methyltransferase